MRDIILLGFTGLLLGLLAGTTLVVVREGEMHTAGIARGETLGAAGLDSVPATGLDSIPASRTEALLPEAGDPARTDSAQLAADTAAPTGEDGRGTPLQADSAVAATAALPAPLTGSATGPILSPEELAKYLGSMQPREAARVLEQMSDAEIARIIVMIGGRRASAIMGSLAPERAAAIGRLALGSQQEEVS